MWSGGNTYSNDSGSVTSTISLSWLPLRINSLRCDSRALSISAQRDTPHARAGKAHHHTAQHTLSCDAGPSRRAAVGSTYSNDGGNSTLATLDNLLSERDSSLRGKHIASHTAEQTQSASCHPHKHTLIRHVQGQLLAGQAKHTITPHATHAKHTQRALGGMRSSAHTALQHAPVVHVLRRSVEWEKHLLQRLW